MDRGSLHARPWIVRGAVTILFLDLLVVALLAIPGDVDWELALRRRTLFLSGLWQTAVISAGALLLGMALGTLTGVLRVSGSVALRQAAVNYVELVRGTPFLVQLYIWYWCIATLSDAPKDWFGVHEATVVGTVGLGVFAGAYIAEIVRGAVESIDRGQWEAARSLGLTHHEALFRVVLPQCVRRLIPPLTGEAVALVKESSLLSVIGVAEVTFEAQTAQAHGYDTFAAFLPLAALYLCLTLPLSLLTRWFERRVSGPQPFPVAEL